MSDWNRDQRSWYPNPNAFAWGEDPRASFASAPTNYYPNHQYVGFNEFISQMQPNGSYGTDSFTGNTPQQYPNSVYSGLSDTSVPASTPQATPQLYQPIQQHNIPDGNILHRYGDLSSSNPNVLRADSTFFTSNLLPTATEFVPKSAQTPSACAPANDGTSIKETRSQETPINPESGAKPRKDTNRVSGTSSNNVIMNGGSSSGSNSTVPIEKINNRKENSKATTSKNKRKVAGAPKMQTTEDVGRTFYNTSTGKPSGSQDIRSRNNDARYDNSSKDNSDNYRDNRDNNRDSYSRDSNRDQRDSNRDQRDSNRDGNRDINRDQRDSNRDINRDQQDSNRDINRDQRDSNRDGNRDIKRDQRDSNRDQRGGNRDQRDSNREGRDSGDYSGRDNYNRDSRDTNRDSYRENTSRERNGRDNANRDTYTRDRDNYGRDMYTLRDNGRDYYSGGSSSYNNSSRNRFGTRFPRSERNFEEDEHYANSYLSYRDERQDSRRPVTSEKLQLVPASPSRNKSTYKRPEKEESTALTQRERLSEQLDRGMLECLVCCERVKQPDPVWSCGNCFHVLHLRCIRKWAMSSLVEGKWRCPACQNQSDMIPTDYLCFCGAMRAPEWVRGSAGAHSCGERCQRARQCPHPCVLPCHPGPCPPCQATLNKKCGCGAETRSVVCSSKLEQVCGRTCGKTLLCGAHHCTMDCHEADCPVCESTVAQVCYCPADKKRTVKCDSETCKSSVWACGDACGRVLSCGAHVCRDLCHPPPCAPCQLLPESVLTCPCGKMKLTEREKRTSCTDPIPLCGNICARPLTCGPPNDLHFCKLECHDGACAACPEKTLLTCRCGHSTREVDCVQLPQMLDNVFCTKKCNKKLSCGRHRCRELCCALDIHRCPQSCGRMLSCGLHRCTEFCHNGHCPPCERLGFTELRCECGSAVQLPPVACGARPPVCNKLCVRVRPCGHEPHHTCHSGECPPCVVLTTKHCHGGHEQRKTIPCHQDEFSCGMPCGKPLPCGKHVCIKLCHKGECATSKCVQQCMEKRPSCGHACGAPCHSGADDSPCPSTAPCRLTVRATCPCRRKSAEKMCADNARDFGKAMSTMVASKMQDGSAVDLSDVTRPGNNLKTLECDDECRVEARTRQMALVLQIRNPDTSSKLAPRYSEHVRQWAVRDAAFADHVHAKLTELVQLAKKSKQKTRSHSFPSMNRQKRQFIHELCEHFGCESVAYDAEPNRNVVATADREKSWLPAMSIMEVLERESGKRRVPGPVLRGAAPATLNAAFSHAPLPTSSGNNKTAGGWATLTSSYSNAWGARSIASSAPAPAPQQPPPIDYFDNPPTD